MRVTVSLDADVAAEVTRLQDEQRSEVSEVVNELARAGIAVGRSPSRPVFRQRTARLGARIPLDKVSEVPDRLHEQRGISVRAKSDRLF
ncbi:hypothetical protein BH23ACT6_BH23ACT6_13080 [soil metagenome]